MTPTFAFFTVACLAILCATAAFCWYTTVRGDVDLSALNYPDNLVNNAERTAELALHTAFLVLGAERGQTEERLDALEALGGQLGLVDQCVGLATIIVEYLGDLEEELDWPGVFEYEVTEPLGAWLIEHPDCSYGQFHAELHARAQKFFRRA